MPDNTRHVVLFFTQDISLSLWKDTGLYEREVLPYLALAKEKGYRVSFLTYGDESDLDFQEALAPIEIIPLWSGDAPKSRLMKVLKAPFALMKHKDKLQEANIYKTNQFWGGWNAIFAKWLWGGKVIARQGYEYFQFAKAQEKPPHQLFIAYILEWFIYKFSDRIVLATQSDADFARSHFHFLDKAQIDIQPNWIDTERFKPSADHEDYKADLVFIGRLNAQKNLPSLIKACADHGYSLDIYGDGELKNVLQIHVSELGSNAIRFMGRVPNDEIPSLLKHYKAFILPSLFEGNPKALLEAMACGKAVIACDVAGSRDVLKDGETGALCDIDDKSIAETIEKIINDPSLRKALGKAARKVIEERYSLERFIEDEEERYEQILKR
ncbi:MAG: hypothetical protein CMH26_04985 [Micavibrio sp.]|nr:hypothetical protein [Micavibrio sp.]|tara:strand:- start:3796 stop:4944 length:1149 start_codon:yes stop_codon:yes gene_type:complete